MLGTHLRGRPRRRDPDALRPPHLAARPWTATAPTSPTAASAWSSIDLTEELKDCEFQVFSGAIANGGVVKAINAKGFADISTGQIDKLTKTRARAGAKGLAYIQARGEDRSTPGARRSSSA